MRAGLGAAKGKKNRLTRALADPLLTGSSLPAGGYTHREDGGTLRRGEENEVEDDGRPAVLVDKYVAFVFAAKETGNNKRAGSKGGKRRTGRGGRGEGR